MERKGLRGFETESILIKLSKPVGSSISRSCETNLFSLYPINSPGLKSLFYTQIWIRQRGKAEVAYYLSFLKDPRDIVFGQPFRFWWTGDRFGSSLRRTLSVQSLINTSETMDLVFIRLGV